MACRSAESRELEAELRRRVATGELSLPDPASGRTDERHVRLLELGRDDLQIARMAEAHTDALSILHEAGRHEVPGALYGVWAAEDPACELHLLETGGPGLVAARLTPSPGGLEARLFLDDAAERPFATYLTCLEALPGLDQGGPVAWGALEKKRAWIEPVLVPGPARRLDLAATPQRPGQLVLTGTKAFCTGGTIVDRALVTVRRDSSVYLIDLDARQADIAFDDCRWRTTAFAATVTSVARFDAVSVTAEDIVGPPGWYLERVGFWHGACGPAACWAGGAIGLVDHAVGSAVNKPSDPHRDAQLGALAALRWQLQVMVEAAGCEIDLDRHDTSTAMRRALMLRHNVERAATTIVDLFGRALGPRPLIEDEAVVRRVGELQIYVRQHHDEHDLESIGRDLRGAAID